MNIRAQDAEHRLTPDQAGAVVLYYQMTGSTLPQDKPVEMLPGLTPAAMRPEYDPQMAAVEDYLQVPRNKRHAYRSAPRRALAPDR